MRRILAVCLLAGATLPAAGMSAPDARDEDLARRTFANAEQLMREGKTEQALHDYEQIASAYTESSVADNALFRIGSYYYPIEMIEDLGTASRTALLRAKELLSRIPSQYPREDMAPHALVKLGLIALDPVNPDRDLDEAYASFSGVVNIYPSSDVVDRALLGSGFAELQSGHLDKSIPAFERVAEEFAESPVAATARFYLGEAFATKGDFVRSLEEFQQMRTLFSQHRLADRALDRLTLIYKTRIQPDLHQRLFAYDPTFKPQLDAYGVHGRIHMAVDADSRLHVLYERTGAVVRLAHDGRAESTGDPMQRAVAIAVGEGGAELVAGRNKFRVGNERVIPTVEDRGALRPLSRITAAVMIGHHEVALLDRDLNEILVYRGGASKLDRLFRDPDGRARLRGLAVGAGGNLYTIDRRGPRILEITPQGLSREVPLAPPGRGRRDLAEIAADDLGNLYVLDERNRKVIVLTAQGRILQQITSQAGSPAEFSYPAALAVGPRAEIYVYDERRKTILRFW